jgi:hypothetical protein
MTGFATWEGILCDVEVLGALGHEGLVEGVHGVVG